MPMPGTEMCFPWGVLEGSGKTACLSALKDEKELAVGFVRIGPSHFIFKYGDHFRISGEY